MTTNLVTSARLPQGLHATGTQLILAVLCSVLMAATVLAQDPQQEGAIQPPQEPSAQIEPQSPQSHFRIGNPLVYQAFQPCRMVDTRNPNGPYGGPKLVAGQTRNFNLVPTPGTCGSSLPSGVKAIVMNVAVAETGNFGFLTIYPGPAGTPVPLASSINWYQPNAIVANEIIIPVGTDGSINVFVGNNPTHLILDVVGYFLAELEGGDKLAISGNVGTNSGVVQGRNNSTEVEAFGVLGEVVPTAPGAFSTGVRGINNGTGGSGIGVWGSQAGSGWGVYGTAGSGGIAVLGTAPTSGGGYAGFFQGNAQVTGTLTKGGGSFKIDHPLDPANKYLSHSFVESPDMMNIYNGNVTTDAKGRAVVTMPDYFTALNRDFRYQLTVIGRFAQAVVSGEIKDNRFIIKTDKPNVKVSWQVTGVRQDAYAEAHRIQVEEEKKGAERGAYMHPELFNQPAAKSIKGARYPEAQKMTQTLAERAATKR